MLKYAVIFEILKLFQTNKKKQCWITFERTFILQIFLINVKTATSTDKSIADQTNSLFVIIFLCAFQRLESIEYRCYTGTEVQKIKTFPPFLKKSDIKKYFGNLLPVSTPTKSFDNDLRILCYKNLFYKYIVRNVPYNRVDIFFYFCPSVFCSD